ncbi:hypothetical protein ABID12_003848 [Martelella mangrovi]|uniref:VRR-NUC domain-containing protein n=1 Tax=Martelella mangrovi TaxID=1397477 RepID=A0ABV2IG23_9HYPH
MPHKPATDVTALAWAYPPEGRPEKSGTQSGVRIVAAGAKASGKNPCDEICEIACDCMNDRQGAQTLTRCVENELRKRYYDPENGTFPDGTARYPSTPESDGPRPEVSYDPNVPNGYIPRNSSRNPGMPSSHYPYTGMPRPDISWWKDGKLWKIFELKFPRAGGGVDGQTRMQRDGAYKRIAENQGLDPRKDVIELDIEKDCTCLSNGGGHSKTNKCEGLKT